MEREHGDGGYHIRGMFGRGAGWGIPLAAPTPLMVTVGGIGEKQTLVEGRLEVREYLSLTISVDHEVVDGAPATRFTQRFKELIESGYGLASTDMAACRGAKSFPCEPPATRVTQ